MAHLHQRGARDRPGGGHRARPYARDRVAAKPDGSDVRDVRVLIADDSDDIRLLTRMLLGSDGRSTVVAEAEDATSAVDAWRDARPDVSVLDHQMPGGTGLEAAAAILAEQPDARVVLFSSFLSCEVEAAAGTLGITCLRKELFADLPALVVDLAAGA